MRLIALAGALFWALAAPLFAVDAPRQAPTRLILPGQAPPASGPIVSLPPRLVDVSQDGRAVYHPPPLTQQAFLKQEHALAEPLVQLRAAMIEARPALIESVRLGEWPVPAPPPTTLSDPCCGDAAPKLALILQRMGLPVVPVEAEFHYYAMWEHPAGRLIVDPTIRQFFGRRAAPPSVPRIFIGRHEDLDALFKSHAAYRTKTYSYSRIYYSDAEVRNASVLKLENELEERADLQALARFLRGRAAAISRVFRPD